MPHHIQFVPNKKPEKSFQKINLIVSLRPYLEAWVRFVFSSPLLPPALLNFSLILAITGYLNKPLSCW